MGKRKGNAHLQIYDKFIIRPSKPCLYSLKIFVCYSLYGIW